MVFQDLPNNPSYLSGPPSANGMPGIHHVMARAIKDIFCRYKTLKGFQVEQYILYIEVLYRRKFLRSTTVIRYTRFRK